MLKPSPQNLPTTFLVFFSLLGIFSSTFTSAVSAYIFLEPDTDTSICANIGSAQHYVRDYPSDWPTYGSYQYEGGVTNWFCRTDTGLRTLPSRVWSNTIPVGTPVTIGKQDIEHFSGSGSFGKDLSKVEWDLDGNGSFEVIDNGPWVTAQGTQNEQVDSTVTAWTTRARYFEAVFTPKEVGNTTLQVRVSWTDGSTVTSAGVFTATTDSVMAGIERTITLAGTPTTGPVLTGANVFLSALSSTSTSGYFSKFEWDLDGDGTYETDSGSQKTVTTSFATPGDKTVGVRVTSRGGSSSTATMNIEARQSPPSGEPGVSINDGGTATNLKAVSLNLAWPEFATEARISNDGGFASSKTKTVPLAALVDWELDDTIKGLFTKVVYVRFNGSGIDNTKTYSDDIILDTTAPTINSSAAAVTTSGIEVKVDATDDITGVEVIEIDINNKKISKEYSKTVKVSLAEAGMTVSGSSVSKVSVTTLRVRVRDAVNNWTEWNDLALPGGTVVASQNQTAKKTLKMNTKKAVTGKAIAQFASLKLPKNSKISVKISASSKKVCKVVKTSVRGIKPGICRITVSVKPRTGKAKIKTVSLRVSK